jgi:L-malate glycosyltransferase
MVICYFGDSGSIHISRWCKHFVSLGHEVHLISFNNSLIEGVRVHHVDAGNIGVSGGNWKVMLSFLKVRKILKQIKPDIFHSHYATSYGITGALCGFHPYIITAHGSDVLITGQRSKLHKLLLQFAFRKADWIHLVATHMLDAVKKIGVNMNKVSVVFLGIDPNLFNNKERHIPENKFVITSTRNLEPVYNIEQLINAVEIVKKEIPEIELNIVGDGSLRSSLETMVEEKNLSSSTIFHGKVQQKVIAEILNQSHLYITVSLSDGNSLSLAEAMACGALCIGTDIPANHQWITNGENGFLVPLHDPKKLAEVIVSAYKNYKNIQEKAAPINGKLLKELAIWQTNMARIEAKYKALIQGKKN